MIVGSANLCHAQSGIIEAQAIFLNGETNPEPYFNIMLEDIGYGGLGAFGSLTYHPTFNNVSAGTVASLNIQPGWYTTIGAGPSIDYCNDHTGFGVTGYLYLETMMGIDESKGKVIVVSNYNYSFRKGHWNMTYLTYALAKEFSVGVHYQTLGPVGARLQMNLPKGFHVAGVIGIKKALISLSHTWGKE